MSLAEAYAEMHRDFNKRVDLLTNEATNILSKYPYDFDDQIVREVVNSILIQNDIDAYTELSDSKKRKILNEKTLFNGILSFHFSVLNEQLFRQGNWLNKNDYPTNGEKLSLRKTLLVELSTILEQECKGSTLDDRLKHKINLSRQLSVTITNTNLESLKDLHTLNILETLSNLFKLCKMILTCNLYFNPIISNKCDMGNSFSTIWSGKTLHDAQLEHLEAKVKNIDSASKMICECLLINENEIDDYVSDEDASHTIGL